MACTLNGTGVEQLYPVNREWLQRRGCPARLATLIIVSLRDRLMYSTEHSHFPMYMSRIRSTLTFRRPSANFLLLKRTPMQTCWIRLGYYTHFVSTLYCIRHSKNRLVYRAIAKRCVCVRPFVRLSVTYTYCVEMAKRIIEHVHFIVVRSF